MIRTITIIATLVLFSLAVSAQSLRPAPHLGLKTIDGRVLNLEDYQGKIVLLNFWATWCPPCRQEIPELIKIQRQYRSRGLQIVGVTYPPEQKVAVRRFARRARINYPVALGTKETKLAFSASETLPVTAIIDSEGNLRDVIEGIMYGDEFDQNVKPLLTPPSSQIKAAGNRSQPGSRIQRRTIMVTDGGYQPSAIALRRGIPARLTFIRNVEASCGTEIVIPAYGIRRDLPLNTRVTVTFTPNRSGRFKFTCGMNMFRGSILVR